MKMVVSLVTTLFLFLSSQIVIAEPEMVFVKGGCFEMGDTFNEGEDDTVFLKSLPQIIKILDSRSTSECL